jgi:hypothetical protein
MTSSASDTVNARIGEYYIQHYSSTNEQDPDAVIFLYTSVADARPLAILMFYRADVELPASYVWEGIPFVVFRSDQFPNVVTTLRYERPLRFFYLPQSNQGFVATDTHEPVGEQEQRLFYVSVAGGSLP